MPSDNFNNYSETNPETRLHKSIEYKTNTLNNVLSEVIPQLHRVAKKLVKTLLNENKILICANGSSTALAQYLAAEFVNRYETNRPALPALSLTSDHIVMAAISNDNHQDEVYSRQIQALGRNNDILFVLVSNELPNSLVYAIKAAHEQAMHVILICGELSEDISPHITNNDNLIQLKLESQPLIYEAQLMSIHSICELVDHLLFGTI